MKRAELSKPRKKPTAGRAAVQAANDDRFAADDAIRETELEALSADYYERRSKMWARFDRGDIWIAVALYLMLASFTFVIW